LGRKFLDQVLRLSARASYENPVARSNALYGAWRVHLL